MVAVDTICDITNIAHALLEQLLGWMNTAAERLLQLQDIISLKDLMKPNLQVRLNVDTIDSL